jgi:8-oxo-dGTP diphosphatase
MKPKPGTVYVPQITHPKAHFMLDIAESNIISLIHLKYHLIKELMETPKHIVAVGGLVTNDNDQALLMYHPVRGWEFPGGQVEVGEDLISALIREIKEETGIIVSVQRLAGVYQNVKPENEHITTKVMFDFLCKYELGELSTSEESLKVGWFEKKSALQMITNQFLHFRFKDMLEFNNNIVFRTYSKNPNQVNQERTI